jgi:signal peptidase II
MKVNRFLRTIIILLLLTLNIGCDQVSKSIVRHKLDYYDRIEFLHRHITLVRVENSGAFLSVGDSLSKTTKFILLNLLPLLVVIVGLVFIFVRTNLDRVILLGLILTIGGGIGNLYDRVVHGSVTDFMHINFGLFQTGIFNVADLSITTGVLILLIQAYFRRKTEVGVTSLD